MGVYIKGMEMPCEEAEPLRIELYADGTVLVIKEQDDFYEFKAVPVPPHGRLGDLDALKTKAIELSEKRGVSVNVLDKVITAFDIETAPTVIPAEEE